METLELNNFLKGLHSRVSADKIPADAVSECVNMDLSEKFVPKSIKGYQKYNITPIVNKPIKGGIVYNNKEAGELVVLACGGFLWWAPLGTANFSKYQINGEDVKIDENVNIELTQYNNELYIVTGKYPVIDNTGYETSCILGINKYTAFVMNRTDLFAWSYDGDTFYTLSETPINGDKIYTDRRFTESAVTVDSFSSGNAYFIGSDEEQYDRLETADQDNSQTPQGINYFFIHQERLFGLASLDDPNGIYWSNPYDPYSWKPLYGLNYDTVGKDDGEKITGGASFGGPYLYVFKPHNVYRYMTSGEIDAWSSNKVDTDYGCVSHRTIKLFEGNLVYLSPNGVVKLNGNQAVLVDDAIRNKTTNVVIGSAITLERSYTKNTQWNYSGSNVNGICTLNNKIKCVKDILTGGENELFSDYEQSGTCVSILNNTLTFKFYRFTAPSDGSGLTYQFSHSNGTFVISKFIFSANVNIADFKFRISGKRYDFSGNINSNDYYILEILTNYDDTTPLYTSDHLLVSSATNDPANVETLEFNFSTINLAANTTYWIRIRTVTESIVTAIYAFYYPATAYGYLYNPFNNSYTSVNYRLSFIAGIFDNDNYTYISKEFDTECENGYDLQSLIVAGSNLFYATIYIANYNDSVDSWDDIYSGDITTIQLNSNTTYTLDLTGKRFLKYKIQGYTSGGIYNVQTFTAVNLKLAKIYNYESEPIRIAGSNPKGWGLSEFTRTGTEDLSNLAKIYMRCADNTSELATATYYELDNNVLINENMPLKQYIQFKVDFPENSDNSVSTIKINYFTVENMVTPCAAVWKTKYILNMPGNNESINNSIEYILDKDGYWVTKDNEENFCYFKSASNLFAGSINDGTIRYKDIGYLNDDTAYTCYFVTKEFALSNVMNLFRYSKLRFKSNINITLGVSVDGKDFVNYIIDASASLIEIRKTFKGIVKGQTIKFKLSWQSNDSTQIHSVILIWNTLRELNRG